MCMSMMFPMIGFYFVRTAVDVHKLAFWYTHGEVSGILLVLCSSIPISTSFVVMRSSVLSQVCMGDGDDSIFCLIDWKYYAQQHDGVSE